MANRKLQTEIDKTLKKVAEGVDIFQTIFEKLQTAANAGQKEKFEGDLKKEIKKLQRHRDQIRSWLSSNEIKDKRALEENRRLIEQQMETFKACEKELKTKAFSKEGLNAVQRVDPNEREKENFNSYVDQVKERLNVQIDALEAEQEQLQLAVKKTRRTDPAKAERLSQIDERLERHKWHINKLEIIQRMVDNGNLKVEEGNAIQEDLDYYVENNQEPDFEEDEAIYDHLNLEEAEMFGLPGADDEESSEAEEPPTPPKEKEMRFMRIKAPPEPVPTKDEGKRKSKDVKEDEAPKSSKSPAARGQVDRHEAKSSVTAAKSVVKAPMVSARPTAAAVTRGHAEPQPSPAAPNFTQRYSAAAAASAAPSEPTRAGSVGPGVPEEKRPTAKVVKAEQQPAVAPTTNIAAPAPAPAHAPPSQARPPSAAAALQSGAPTPAPDSPLSKPPGVTRPAAGQPMPVLPTAEPSVATDAPRDDGSEAIDNRLPPSLADLVSSFEATKERSLKAREDTSFFQHMLETSFQYVPDALDSERPKYYLPKNPYPVPGYYPQAPFALFENPMLFEKFDIDTLFFIFYYQQGTYQQYLAARELKRQSWRFHKKYLTWFQRHEEPKSITDEYEQGTYIYFDYEGAWCQRKKGEFRFEYRFLEDAEM
ncbi:general negative regulator of transcription subunit 5 [Borealophlyctis nickersoniae]|nr:general negative regulator of transcription subunit 5 [Borealophlyctis nickersoniae]